LEEEYELAKGENIKKETEIQRLKGDIEALRNEVDVLKGELFHTPLVSSSFLSLFLLF